MLISSLSVFITSNRPWIWNKQTHQNIILKREGWRGVALYDMFRLHFAFFWFAVAGAEVLCAYTMYYTITIALSKRSNVSNGKWKNSFHKENKIMYNHGCPSYDYDYVKWKRNKRTSRIDHLNTDSLFGHRLENICREAFSVRHIKQINPLDLSKFVPEIIFLLLPFPLVCCLIFYFLFKCNCSTFS